MEVEADRAASAESRKPARIVIRRLAERDVEEFVRWRGGDEYKDRVVRDEIGEHFAGKRVLFVAEAMGQLVGTVQFVPMHDDPDLADGRATAYLQALEVREDSRRKGLGTRLVAEVEHEALRGGFRRLTLMVEPDNELAICLYRTLGFAAFKDSFEMWRGRPLPTTCMFKRVSGECPRPTFKEETPS